MPDGTENQKLSIADFAKRIKTKYAGSYDELDDADLVERFVIKNPVYADRVDLPQGFSLRRTTTGYKNLDDLYEKAGREHNVDVNLLIEQGRNETINFKPDVVYGRQNSPAGAQGAGQFMPGTAPLYGVRDRKDPIQSIYGQAKYMRKLLDQFDDDENLALAGYNAGEYRDSLKKGQIPQIKETQKYVKDIGANLAKARSTYGQLRGLLGQQQPQMPTVAPTPTVKSPVAPINVEQAFQPQVQTLGGTENVPVLQTPLAPQINADAASDPAYLAFLKETGLTDSPASQKEYQTVQGVLAQQQAAIQSQGTPTQPQQPVQQKPAAQTQQLQTPTGEVSATAEWTGANAKEGALDSAASKLASQIGVDYDLVRQSLGEGGFEEGEFTKELAERGKKERREVTFALDAQEVKNLQNKHVKRQEYLRQLDEKTQAYAEQTKNPFEASLLAAKDLGVKDFKGRPIDDVINEERQAVAEFEAANARPQNPAEAYNRILQTEGGRLSAGETPEALVQEFYAKQAAKTDELKKDVLAKYGSFSKQKSERERIEKEYGTIGDSTRPMARPSEFLLNIGREIANLPGQASKALGIAADAMSPAGIPPDQNPFVQFGNDWEKRVNESQNKDLKDELIVGDVSKALAQLMEQTVLIPFTGGASVALPIAQGGISQYDEAAKAGATRNQRIWSATVGGVAAAPGAVLEFNFLKALSPAAKANFFDDLTRNLFTGLAKRVTADEAKQLTLATIGELTAKAPVGYFTEKYQERSEDVINKAAAKLTYKPDLTWKDVITASPREEQGYEAAGLVGLLGAGSGSVVESLSSRELENTNEILQDALKRQEITPDQAETIQAKAQAELAKRGGKISLKPIQYEPTPESVEAPQTQAEPKYEPETKSAEIPQQPAPISKTEVLPDAETTTAEKPIKDAGQQIKDFFAPSDEPNAYTKDLRNKLWAKAEKGDTTELGKESGMLQGAKILRENGGLKTQEEFNKYVDDFTENVSSKTGEDFQQAARGLLKKYAPEQPSAPVSGEEKKPTAPVIAAEPQIVRDSIGKEFEVVETRDDGKVVVEDKNGKRQLKNADKLTPVGERRTRMVIEPPKGEVTGLPDFDVEKFKSETADEYTAQGVEPKEAQRVYVEQVLGVAEMAKQARADLAGLKATKANAKKRDALQMEIDRLDGTVTNYRNEAERFFGKDTADYIEDQLYAIEPPPKYVRTASGKTPEQLAEFRKRGEEIIRKRKAEKSVAEARLKSVATAEEVPAFFSQAERMIEAKMPKKASADQVRGLLKDAKKEELEWLDMDGFLRNNPNPTKSELLDYVRANNVDVQESVKGKADLDKLEAEWEAAADAVNSLGHKSKWQDPDLDRLRDIRDDLRNRINSASQEPDNTKFSKFTLPGGENYRELLLTLPDQNNRREKLSQKWFKKSFNNLGPSELSFIKQELNFDVPANEYKSPHWEESNVLAHIRFDERDNGQTLHIAEIQSDWHQEGRKKGYAKTEKPWVVFDTRIGVHPRDFEIARFKSEAEAKTKATENAAWDYDNETIVDGTVGKVPHAPFKTSWPLMAFKRVLRYAAENGYERISWDTGDTQADRYDLSKQVASIVYTKHDNGKYDLGAWSKERDTKFIEIKNQVAENNLADYIGKDLAQKIVDGTAGSKAAHLGKNKYQISGPDLKVGGEGMKAFYDKILPAEINKYVKKWGAKVEETTLEPQALSYDEGRALLRTGTRLSGQVDDGMTYNIDTIHQFEAALEAGEKVYHEASGAIAHSLEITPAMRESVMQGQPLYKKRDIASLNLLTKTLPKAHTQDVLEGIESTIQGNDLELNEYGSEAVRRLMGERAAIKNKTFDDTEFDGITLDAKQVRELAKIGRDLIPQYKEVGYTDDQLAPFSKMLDDLDALAEANEDFAVMYVYEDALPEEQFHQEDLRAGRTTKEALAELKKSPIWTNPGERFESEYPKLSDKDKASELAAKLATDQAEKYGWTEIEDFENVRDSFLASWADGIVDNNKELIESEGIEAFQRRFVRTSTYATFQESQTTGETEIGRDASLVEADSEIGEEKGGRPETGSEPQDADGDRTTEESAAAGVSESEVTYRNRKHADYLRKHGLEAEDVPYIPETERGWQKKGREIVEKSLAEKGDYSDAIAEFNNPKNISGGERTALAYELIDRLGPEGDYTAMREITDGVIVHEGNAGAILRAAQIVAKYDFAKAVETATKAVKKKGKTLSDKDIEKLRRDTAKYAETEEELTTAIQLVEEAKAANDRLQAEIDEINSALAEADKKRTINDKLITQLRRQVSYWKNKKVSESRPRRTAAYKDLLDKKPALLDKIRAVFGDDVALKSAANETALKSAASPIDEDTRNALIDYASLQILEHTKYEDLIANLKEITGLSDAEIGAIHADAVENLKGSGKQSDKVKETLAIRNEHKKEARRFRDGGLDLNRLDREILKGVDDAKLVFATLLWNRALNPHDFKMQMQKEFPGMTAAEVNATLKDVGSRREKARAALKKAALEKKAEKSLSDAEVKKYTVDQRVKQSNARKSRQSLDRMFRQLGRSVTAKIGEGLMEAVNFLKGTAATGEISYLLRQGLLPLITESRAAIKGDWQGVGHGLQGDNELVQKAADALGYENVSDYLNENSTTQFIEQIRDHARLAEAQAFGVRFSEIGDHNIADEHFSSRLLEKVPLYKRLELAYTLPGDLQRLYIYDVWANLIEGQGLTADEETLAKKYAGKVVNALSGKGDIGSVLAKGGALSKLANVTFFSPSLLVSRFQSMYYLTTGFATAPKGMRMMMAKKGLRAYAVLGLVAYLLGMNLDPDDDEFGKIRPRKGSPLAKALGEDVQLNPLAGMDLPVQLLWRNAGGMFKAIQTGDSGYFTDAASETWQQLATNKRNEPRFLRGKLSPSASWLADYYTGTDYIGRPYTHWNAATSRLTPMSWGQVYDALVYDRYEAMMKEPATIDRAKYRFNDAERDYANALSILIPTFLGVGVNQYPKGEMTPAVRKASQIRDYVSSKDAETIRIEGGLRNLIKEKIELQAAGLDTAKVSAAIREYSAKYKVELSKLESQAKSETGLLSFYAKDLTEAELNRVLPLANDVERKVLEKILKERAKKQKK